MGALVELMREERAKHARATEIQARLDQAAQARQAAHQAGVERERAMIRELSTMRQVVERSEARAAVADERAVRAEARELAAGEASKRREQMMLALTVICAIAAVAAIFVPILIR